MSRFTAWVVCVHVALIVLCLSSVLLVAYAFETRKRLDSLEDFVLTQAEITESHIFSRYDHQTKPQP